MNDLDVPAPPGPLRRFLTRWLALYLGLWFIPSPLGELPWIGGTLSHAFSSAKERGAQWFSGLWPGAQPVGVDYSGGSDRTVDYYAAALTLILSGSIAAVLSARRVSARQDGRLLGWLRGYLKLVLACTMLLYGLAKVFPLQFVEPTPRVLTMKVGDLTPEDLMWLFMGASTPYVVFSGVAEVVGGVLLLWRRTTLLGASILFVVMANVTLLDLCYDVNMKLAASHLLLAIIFVIAPDAPCLARAFLQSTATDTTASATSRAGMVARYTIVTLVAGQLLHSSWTVAQDMRARHPLHGIWEVADASPTENCDPPHAPHTIAIQRAGIVVIGHDHARRIYKLDPSNHDPARLRLLDFDTDRPIGTLRASSKSQKELSLAGDLGGEPLQLVLRRSKEPMLSSHRFQWTNDHVAKPR